MNKHILFLIAGIALITMSCKPHKTNQGLDLGNLDTTVPAKTDFYQYACGGWMKKFPLPAEYARYGSFDKLQEDNQKKLKDLITGLAATTQKTGSVAEKIAALYKIGMDSVQLEKQGIAPVKANLETVNGIKDEAGMVKALVNLHKQYISPFFNVDVNADQKNSLMNILNLRQGGLSLPDRDYYLGNDPAMKEVRTQYLQHIEKMLVMAGFTPADAKLKAEKVLKIETSLARISSKREDLRDPVKNYNKMTVAAFAGMTTHFDWKAYLSGVGAGSATELNVGQPAFFKSMDSLLAVTPIDDIKAYFTWKVVNDAAPYLTPAMEKQNFEFFGKALSGKEEMKARWKRVVDVINGTLGEAVGQLYVEKYFPPQAKEKMLQLVENLRLSLGDRISQSTWMSDETKKKAQEKLQAIKVKIGYPEKWRDYSSLRISNDSYYNNMIRSSMFEFEYRMNKLGKPVDKTEWQMTPQTVNAYYEPTINEICFPAAILQPPFFNFDADDAVNYGAIGVVIGHEMTHGFDDQGRQYDKDGNLKDWWTPADADRFKERTAVLVRHFSDIKVLDTLHANGTFTLGENIADQGGLQVSFHALQKALEKNAVTEKTGGFTPQQRFFLAYANIWAQNIRDKEIIRRTKIDPHSLGKWRVDGALPNVTAFQEAFGIKEGDAMWLSPEMRANIW
ncbi:MAG: M13 family metallopeptidase [Bacteroidetes bacterium]|nr:M13 family metallopeptidase [Bacteroidota bacterium]